MKANKEKRRVGCFQSCQKDTGYFLGNIICIVYHTRLYGQLHIHIHKYTDFKY